MGILESLDYLGTFAFAVSGALAAVRHRVDVFGVVALAAITAVGGGTMRDIMLGAQPIFWLAQPVYLLLALLAALPVCVWYPKLRWTQRVLAYADAVGLGVFTVIGASKALALGAGFAGAVVFGCMTGVGGGVIRDVLVREVPLVFRREVYASAAIAGSVLFCVLAGIGAPAWVSLLVGATTTTTVRAICVARRVDLPRPGDAGDPDEG